MLLSLPDAEGQMAEVVERVAKLEESVTDMKESLGRIEARLETGLSEGRSELHTGLAAVRGELHAGLTDVRTEMRTGFADVRTEMRSGFVELKQSIAHTNDRLDKGVSQLRSEMHTQFYWLLGTIAAGVGTLLATILSTRP
jgi:hypothetical protein